MAKTSRAPGKRVTRAPGPKHARKTPKAAARTPAEPDEDAQVDGCDVDFEDSEVTADAELPGATGGVDTGRKTPRRTTRRRKSVR